MQTDFYFIFPLQTTPTYACVWCDEIIPMLDGLDACRLEICSSYFRSLLADSDKQKLRDRWILTHIVEIIDQHDLEITLAQLQHTYHVYIYIYICTKIETA